MDETNISLEFTATEVRHLVQLAERNDGDSRRLGSTRLRATVLMKLYRAKDEVTGTDGEEGDDARQS